MAVSIASRYLRRLIAHGVFAVAGLSLPPTVFADEGRLEIAGILAGSEQAKSAVIFTLADGRQKTFLPGETLPNGMQLMEIRPHTVVVMRDGWRYTLKLSWSDTPPAAENDSYLPDADIAAVRADAAALAPAAQRLLELRAKLAGKH